METTSSSLKRVIILRWIARIMGTFVVIFFSSLYIGEFMRKGYLNIHYPVMFALMLLSMIGILLAWKWEGIGGLLGAISIIISDLLNLLWFQTPKIIGGLIGSLLWLIPSIIFIYCWWFTKSKLKMKEI